MKVISQIDFKHQVMYRIPTMHNFSPAFSMNDDWTTRSQQLQQENPQLAKEDLDFTSDNENELLERVGDKLNRNREEVIHIIRKGSIDQF
jgi:hypothetical protein